MVRRLERESANGVLFVACSKRNELGRDLICVDGDDEKPFEDIHRGFDEGIG